MIVDTLNEMLSLQLFEVLNDDQESQILFHSTLSMSYFNIWLNEFIRQKRNNSRNASKDRTCIDELEKIINKPAHGGKIDDVQQSLNAIKSWLNTSLKIEKSWFPSINVEIDLVVRRQDAYQITGNIQKHAPQNLDSNAKKISRIFSDNNRTISEDQAKMIIGEFEEWFFEHAFNYDSTMLVKLLNDLKWGLVRYFKPTLQSHRRWNVGRRGEKELSLLPCEHMKSDYTQWAFSDLISKIESSCIPPFQVNRFLRSGLNAD